MYERVKKQDNGKDVSRHDVLEFVFRLDMTGLEHHNPSPRRFLCL